jgi:hypothetical protein
MISRTVKSIVALLAFCVVFAQADTTSMLTIITNIKKNTDRIKSYGAEFTLKEDSSGTCVPRKAKLYYGKPDTNVFWLQNGTGWISHSSIMGDSGDGQFPKYEAVFTLALLADTFPNTWINADIPFFTGAVTYEDNDSIVIHHMNSSVVFDYTVDKKRWVVTRIIAGGYDVYDAKYTWAKSTDSIYYPTAINVIQADLCAETYQFTNVKLVGLPVSAVLDRRNAGKMAGSRTVSVGLISTAGVAVSIMVPAGDNLRGISISDASGRLVQKLACNNAPGKTMLWDGKGVNSRQVPAGVYFVTVMTDRSRISAKLPLVK